MLCIFLLDCHDNASHFLAMTTFYGFATLKIVHESSLRYLKIRGYFTTPSASQPPLLEKEGN
jgi:hypothetical protein